MEESHDTADWREYRVEQQGRRTKRLVTRVAAIMALREEGFAVKELSPYHFRVNGRLDLYPTHNLWHDIKTKQRGKAKLLDVFVREWVKQ